MSAVRTLRKVPERYGEIVALAAIVSPFPVSQVLPLYRDYLFGDELRLAKRYAESYNNYLNPDYYRDRAKLIVMLLHDLVLDEEEQANRVNERIAS